jgi:subtilisin family serine protease
MGKVILLFFASCLLFAASSVGSYIPGLDNSAYKSVKVDGQFIVRFADNVDLNGISRGFGMIRIGIPSVDNIFDKYSAEHGQPIFPSKVGKSVEQSRFYLIRLSDSKEDDAFMEAMVADPNVVSIEHDVACIIHATPNDPNHSNQWHLYQSSRMDVHAHEAWDIETGYDTAIIAIVDVGVLYNHPDLRNNIWVNPGEDVDGDMVVFDSTDIDNIDDDHNGYRDDLVGYDFLSGGSPAYDTWPGEDASVKDNDPKDFNGHGTHCAGIAAAVNNNNTGVCGLAGGWGPYIGDRGVRIMCLRAGYSVVHPTYGYETGILMMSAVAEAFQYAVDNGAHVISYSAGATMIPALLSAIIDCKNAGIVICHSAGNDGGDVTDDFSNYPGLISVGWTNSSDRKDGWSNYGVWVEVAAPGTNIYSTVSNHYSPSYTYMSGSSFSCPLVAGLAGLIKSHHPEFDKNEIDTIIINNADSINDPYYHNGLLGSGRINAYNCLQNAPLAKFDVNPRQGEIPLTVSFADQSPAAGTWMWDFGNGQTSTDESPPDQLYSTPGLYDVSLEVTDPNGTHKEIKKYHIFASEDTLYGPDSVIIPPVPYDSFPVEISLKNSVEIDQFDLVFLYPSSGSPDLTYKGASRGARTAYFDSVQLRANSDAAGKVAVRYVASMGTNNNALPPGDGPVAILWFKATGAGEAILDTVTYVGYSFEVENRFVDYTPEFNPINIFVVLRGDANGDGAINTGDPVYLIAYIFKGGPAPPSVYQGDANADGQVNVADAVYLIYYIFKGGPPPPP